MTQIRRVPLLLLFFLWGIGAFAFVGASGNGPTRLSGHTPPFTATAVDLGAADPATPMQIRFWLKLRQPEKLALESEQVYDPGSFRYHHWMSASDFLSTFAPTVDSVSQVVSTAEAHGLVVTQVDPGRWFVTTIAPASVVERTFHIELHRFLYMGEEVIANTSDPQIDAAISGIIQRIGGLNTMKVRAMHIGRKTSGSHDAVPLTTGATGTSYETVCFRDSETVNFSTSGAMPQATYTGTRYGSDLNSAAPHLSPCGYGPPEVEAAYGMKDLYKTGLDGTGQTVVIVDAFGSPTIQSDAAAHAALYGLPAPALNIIQPAGPPVQGPWNADQQGWSLEVSLDVEYVHAMAPGATIDLVEALTDSDDDLTAAIAYTVENDLGYVISNSWAGPESSLDPATTSLYVTVFQAAVSRGISLQFSSGDSGDNFAWLGYSDVFYPASFPYVTGVGGTSLALNADKSVKFQTGWGNNLSQISQGVDTPAESQAMDNTPNDPPVVSGFYAGSGGGESRMFPKPEFQRSLAGTRRGVPDISYLADPYTGVEFISPNYDANGNVLPSTLSVIGGTSLSCPLFSAMWAVADQAAGTPLGQAARILYLLPKNAIIDMLPLGSSDNVIGSVTDSSGVAQETALQLGFPETEAPFLSALYDDSSSPYSWNVITFGTDTSLATSTGWDPVTGLGVPNGKAFVDAVTGSSAPSAK